MMLEARIQEGERVAFWEEFEDTFGPVGRDPAAYYSFEIGDVLSVTPDTMSELTPADLMGAMSVFNAKYRGNG